MNKPTEEPGWVIIPPKKHKEFKPKRRGDQYWSTLLKCWMKSSRLITCFYPDTTYRRRRAATASQPKPGGDGVDITALVQSDLEARSQLGVAKYGTRLKVNNGRCSLTDAYQEALDLCCYLRQAIAEKDEK